MISGYMIHLLPGRFFYVSIHLPPFTFPFTAYSPFVDSSYFHSTDAFHRVLSIWPTYDLFGHSFVLPIHFTFTLPGYDTFTYHFPFHFIHLQISYRVPVLIPRYHFIHICLHSDFVVYSRFPDHDFLVQYDAFYDRYISTILREVVLLGLFYLPRTVVLPTVRYHFVPVIVRIRFPFCLFPRFLRFVTVLHFHTIFCCSFYYTFTILFITVDVLDFCIRSFRLQTTIIFCSLPVMMPFHHSFLPTVHHSDWHIDRFCIHHRVSVLPISTIR